MSASLTERNVGSFEETKQESSDQERSIAVRSSHTSGRGTPTKDVGRHEDSRVDSDDQVCRERLPCECSD
jgi:hypothetical protein